MSEFNEAYRANEGVAQDLLGQLKRLSDTDTVSAESVSLALPSYAFIDSHTNVGNPIDKKLAMFYAGRAYDELNVALHGRHSFLEPLVVRTGSAYTVGSWQQCLYQDGFEHATAVVRTTFKDSILYREACQYLVNLHDNEPDQETTSIMVIDGSIAAVKQYYGRDMEPWLTPVNYDNVAGLADFLRTFGP